MDQITVLPVQIIAFWSRIRLGWWATIPVLVSLIWGYINPRIFPKPKSTNSWASKAVLGERVWINRRTVPIPEHHKSILNILVGISGFGVIFIIWGVYRLEVWPTAFGLSWVYLGKLWFVDRCVWLFEEMKHIPEYGKWLY